MGRKKRSSTPPPPPKVKKPEEVTEVIGDDAYLQDVQEDKYTMQDTLLTSPIEPKTTMMGSVKKNKPKNESEIGY